MVTIQTGDSKAGAALKYTVDDGQKLRTVNGFLISPGLGIHREPDRKWTVDHIPSGTMLSEVPSQADAEKIAEYLKPMIDWTKESSASVLWRFKGIRSHLQKVKSAVICNDAFPVISKEVEYEIIFFGNPDIRSRYPVFQEAWTELGQLVGLDTIKKEMSILVEQLRGQMVNRGKVKEEKPSYHMLFEGSPGTGKTVVARIVAKILYSLGCISKNMLIETDRGKIVKQYIGATDENMAKLIQESMGGVLFIDEAYALAEGGDKDFGKQAIDILIKAMEDHRDKFVVILAGYPAEMKKLLKSNSGFESRIKTTFHFDDYTPEQVKTIIMESLHAAGYQTEPGVDKVIESYLTRVSEQGTVKGNARAARNITSDIRRALNVRIGKSPEQNDTTTVLIEDVEEAISKSKSVRDEDGLKQIEDQALRKLDQIIGMEELKKQVKSYIGMTRVSKQRYELGLAPIKPRLHMTFEGPPGTGKTTVARIIGEYFKGSGILSSGHFTEVRRPDLVAEYLGQTAIKTKEVLERAKGGVLFIDEAYSLVNGAPSDYFGIEALDEIIAFMENERDDLVIIFAGYAEDMDRLMEGNSGLKSRIGKRLDFSSYDEEEIQKITELSLRNKGILLDEELRYSLREQISLFKNMFGFFEGNGRWADNLADNILVAQSERLAFRGDEPSMEDLSTVTRQDIETGLQLMKPIKSI